MKLKIFSIGIILCLIAACNVTNSKKKVNPQEFNGVYSYHYQLYTTVDSVCKLCVGREFDIAFMKVDYPLFHVCIKQTDATVAEGQEEVKVARKDSNLYEIKEVNGHMVTTNNVFYKITRGTAHIDGNINHYLHFSKVKNGKEHYFTPFDDGGDNDLSNAFQKCASVAPDTTGFFPSSARYAVKPK